MLKLKFNKVFTEPLPGVRKGFKTTERYRRGTKTRERINDCWSKRIGEVVDGKTVQNLKDQAPSELYFFEIDIACNIMNAVPLISGLSTTTN